MKTATYTENRTVPTPMASSAPVPAPNVSNIDTTETVSLVIHKHEGAPATCANDGTDVSQCVLDAGKRALQGAQFTVTPVLYDGAAIDLTTNAGWELAATFFDEWNRSMTTLPDGYTLGTPQEKTTGADGIATFDGAMTLYVVQETMTPPAQTGDPVGTTYTAMAQPFAVTLPMATADGTGWIYDVHAFPKNTKASIVKEVVDGGTAGQDSGTTASKTITYVVSTTIDPGYLTAAQVAELVPPATGRTLDYYAVHDTFDSRLTPPTAAQVSADIRYGATRVPLINGTDYTVTVVGQKVSVLMTRAGLDKLVTAQQADPAAKMFTIFPTTLKSANCVVADPEVGQVVCHDGDIRNMATFTPNNEPGVDSDGNPVTHPETPSNVVYSLYAKIKVVKTNNEATDNLLKGAEFSLYQVSAEAQCSADGIAGATLIAAEAVTGNDGAILWNSLKTSTWSVYTEAGATTVTQTSANHNYCVVETKAPVGYVLPENPYTFVLLPDNADATVVVPITNMEQVGNQLPLTGGQGIAAMSIVGLLLIGGGVAYYSATSRKRKVEVEA